MPQLGYRACSGRAWRLWAARPSQEVAGPPGAQPLPRVLKLATSKPADVTAFDHSGAAAPHGLFPAMIEANGHRAVDYLRLLHEQGLRCYSHRGRESHRFELKPHMFEAFAAKKRKASRHVDLSCEMSASVGSGHAPLRPGCLARLGSLG